MATSLQAFDGDTLEAALARVAEECGPHARITQAEKVRTGGVAGFFARERFEVLVEVDGLGAPSPADPAPAEPMSLLALADQVSDRERSAGPPAPERTAPLPSTEGRTFQEVLRGIASQAGLLDQLPSEDPADPPAPEVEAPSAAQPTHPRPASNMELFASLGIPQHLLVAPGAEASVAQRLLAVLERVPPAPPVIARRGDVVAVIGDGAAAVEAAAVLAGEVGQTIEDVVVAGPAEHGFNRLQDVASAQARAQLWRRCGVPFVVAICAPPGPAGAAWAREMAEALDPVATWGAVGADRKPEDIVRWVRDVGGVDALAVAACDATASPAAVLATGIPVATVEGRRATPAAWTALLVERLTV